MPNVLVTGADGFVGSHLVEVPRELRGDRLGLRYNAFNSYGWFNTVDEDVQNTVEIFSGDVRKPNGVREAMRCIDVVYHLSVLISISYSFCHLPDTHAGTNVMGILIVLQATRRSGYR